MQRLPLRNPPPKNNRMVLTSLGFGSALEMGKWSFSASARQPALAAITHVVSVLAELVIAIPHFIRTFYI